MKLTDSAVGNFRKLWKEHYGEDITPEQAQEYGERLIRVVKVLVDPSMHQRERAPP